MSNDMISRAVCAGRKIGLPDEMIQANMKGHCVWQTDTSLVDLDTCSDTGLLDIQKELNDLRDRGFFVYAGFKCSWGLGMNVYLCISEEEGDTADEVVTDTSFDDFPNLKIVFIAASSSMTHGSFDFGDAYIDCTEGRLSRVCLEDIMKSLKTSVF